MEKQTKYFPAFPLPSLIWWRGRGGAAAQIFMLYNFVYYLQKKWLVFLARLTRILAKSNENYRRCYFQAFANISGKFPGNFRKILNFTTVIICNCNSNVTWSMCAVLDSIKTYSTWIGYYIYYSTPQSKLCKRCICYGWHIRLSVRLSVTIRYYVKTKDRRMQSLPPGSPEPPVFWRQEWLMGDDSVQSAKRSTL